MKNNLHYDQLRNITIGSLDFISPTEFKVLLDFAAPQNTAINQGVPTPFPKINGFVLIPNEIGAIVAVISWIGIEQSAYPKRKGFKDFDLIDLPFPQRKMSINPLGVLKNNPCKGYVLERGVYTYPSVGDVVILPTPEQLEAIVTNRNKNAQVNIGIAPIAANAPVNIDPDKLFGRHLAVLGNTGSGKSCTVAGLIRWSLQAARQVKATMSDGSLTLNSRFIILDPNGEYTSTFDDMGPSVKKYKVKIEDQEGFEQLTVPAWLWNSSEWISFSRAAPGAQRPLLLEALTLLRRGKAVTDDVWVRLNRFLNGYKQFFKSVLAIPPAVMQQRDNFRCRDSFEHLLSDLDTYLGQITVATINGQVSDFQSHARTLYHKNSNLSGSQRFFNGITEKEINELIAKIDSILQVLPVQNLPESDVITADTPKEFQLENLPDFLEQIASLEGGDFGRFVNTLNLRLRILINDERAKQIVNPDGTIQLDQWLTKHICGTNADSEQITVIDLSLVPSEIVHLIIAVISRLIFEALQRYRHLEGKELPTVMVLEEAHSFVRRYSEEDEASSARMCCQTFERIAREGRKFGLGLLLSSQRPSELSPTVLSQCNTFILHRLVNDRDQELVGKLVPDNLGGLLNELPVLPTRKAILLGWAAPIPILVEINELKYEQRPHSNDPKFWNVWTGVEQRNIDWKKIADEWTGSGSEATVS